MTIENKDTMPPEVSLDDLSPKDLLLLSDLLREVSDVLGPNAGNLKKYVLGLQTKTDHTLSSKIQNVR
jgi:hypothetical protein